MNAPIEHLLNILDEHGGTFAVAQLEDGEWTASLVFGAEADDSPMAAGAAHGLGETMEAAFEAAAREAGWKPTPPPGFLQTPGGEHRAAWTGPWPPPERMLIISVEGGFRWFPLEEILALPITLNAIREGVATAKWQVHEYALGSASRITDADIVDMTHVVRGAEYILVGNWEPPGVDDERPTVDGTVCGEPVLVAAVNSPVAGVQTTAPCALDKGHDGGHVPVTAP